MRLQRVLSLAVLMAVVGLSAMAQMDSPPQGTATAPEAAPDARPGLSKYGQPVTTEINAPQMITIKGADRDLSGYFVTPKLEMSETKRPSVILIHDIFGMTDWIKSFANDLAKQGYTVIVPNLYSRVEGSDKGLDAAAAAKAYAGMSDQQAVGDIHAALEYLEQEGQPTAKQPIAVVGVDMGGIYAMESAGRELRISAAVNFYGRLLYANTTSDRPVSPVQSLFNLQVPLLSFYGTLDPQVPADQVKLLSQRLANNPNHIYYETVQFPGVGHGFMEPGREGYNAEADKDARAKMRAFLARYLRAEPAKDDTAI